MSLSTDHSATDQSSRQDAWPSVVRIIILEIVLLVALTGALVLYLNWSSEAAVSEFMATSHFSQNHPLCERKA